LQDIGLFSVTESQCTEDELEDEDDDEDELEDEDDDEDEDEDDSKFRDLGLIMPSPCLRFERL
jgi:hypothetical protein